MSTLSKEFRRQLESTVLKAREEAERGAAAALEELGLTEARIPVHLNEDQQKLRRRLRAHGKQVGDTQMSDKVWDISHLIHECAYEHWHRMLFARFLAENGFLIEPESGLDVDLDFCEERARETKSDKWEVAAGFAQRMLPGIFRPDDPVLQLRLPAESRNRLTALLASLPRDVFHADDSLGWVYQFWQAKKKDEVNASGVKIGADELSPVTQLFTEDYMVEFLLHNTLGAWWAGRYAAVNSDQFSVASCPTEEAARKACALPGVDWKYLRFVQKDGNWVPATGTFAGWPKTVKELRLLDPCMGSGHFLVFALVILVRMRMEEEGLSARDACVAVLQDNLFGLELDPRCTQIAAFNLALAAWKLGGHHAELPLNLACSGLGLHAKKEDWLKLAERAAQTNALAADSDLLGAREETLLSQKLKAGMERLYQLFQKAPVLGSLINPRALGGDLLMAEFHELQPLLAKALQRETGDEAHELAVTAQGVAKAAEILAANFTLVITNVPYLSNRKQCDELKSFCTGNYPDAKNDLGVTFMLRLLDLCSRSGSVALVMSQYWLFKSSYSKVRESLLCDLQWPLLAKLGVGAFETISGEVVNVMAGVWNKAKPEVDFAVCGINVMECASPVEKADALKDGSLLVFSQAGQLKNPSSRIVVGETSETSTLETMAIAPQGTKTGDDGRWRMCMWEINPSNPGWLPYQTTVRDHENYGGRHLYLDWRAGGEGMVRPRIENRAVGKWGVAISQSGDLPATIYSGERFDSNIAPLIINDSAALPALWAYCTSEDYLENVRLIDQSLKVTNVPLIQVPFDLAHWQKVGAEKYPNGLPKPFSSDPTQWLFSGHPKGSDHPLQVAVARLVGYRWPRQTGSEFPDCPALGPDGLEKHADNDGVVCFSQARDESPAAERLRTLLADAYGAEWSHAMERKLIAASGSNAESLEDWLVNDFFGQHCEIFHIVRSCGTFGMAAKTGSTCW